MGHACTEAAGLGLPNSSRLAAASAQAQAALAQFAGTNDPATQKDAITKLQHVMSTEVPMTPLLYGAAWSEISTRNYTGWPTSSNAYMTPVPNSPYLEQVVLHLKPAA
jgi:peptide/nickel transport system substrate-binding protein